MDEISLEILLFIMIAGFVAAFIDSVVGGGGLISIPALMLTGLPMVQILGTNKVGSTMGAFCSVLSFMRSGKVDFQVMKYLFPMGFIGSALGVYTVHLIPSDFLKPMVIVMLIVVTIYSLFRKEWGKTSTYTGMTKNKWILSGLVAVSLGFYDGFFGPGAGSFMLFGFLCIGFEFVGAAANARALNFSSNFAGALAFSYLGLVNFYYAIPMGCAMIFGALLGTKLAVTKGSSYVRPLFIAMTTILIGKQLYDMLK